jgi:hypothetical protein
VEEALAMLNNLEYPFSALLLTAMHSLGELVDVLLSKRTKTTNNIQYSGMHILHYSVLNLSILNIQTIVAHTDSQENAIHFAVYQHSMFLWFLFGYPFVFLFLLLFFFIFISFSFFCFFFSLA